MKHGKIFALVLTAITSVSLNATEIIYDKKAPHWGVSVFPLEEQTWRSKIMTYPGKVTTDDWVWIGPDFFESEYSKPLNFNKKDIKDFDIYYGKGNHKIEGGCLTFKTGRKGFFFGFGGIPNDKSRPGDQFGGAWGKYMKDRYRMKMEMEQNVNESSWTFCYAGHDKYDGFKKFNIKGKGKHVFEIDLGFVRNLSCFRGRTGIKFTCDTPGADIKIKSIKIAPVSAYVYFRKKFTLPEKPILAHATFQNCEVYELYVNGQKVSEGNRVYPAGHFKSVDLRPYLKKGENVIAFRREFVYWIIGKPDWLFEGVAVDRNGTVVRLLGDKSWKCAIEAGKAWMDLAYDDSKWKTPRLSDYYKTFFDYKTKVASGFNPKYMGMLNVQITGQKYPVFDYKKSPNYKVRLPIGVKDKYKVGLKIFEAGTDKLARKVALDSGKDEKDFVSYDVKLKPLPVGPYRLIWELRDKNGKVVEARREELISVGPIKQEEIGLADFEENFEKRLKLVQHIDCTKDIKNGDEFLDHAGMYNPARINKGGVVSKNGMTYRETGKGHWDYFAYRLRLYDKESRELKDRGKPYMVEVIVPDNAKRYIFSAVVEQYPLMFCNNPNGRGRHTATGTCLTGSRFPITNKKRKLRYIFYPQSNASAVIVMNGLPDSAAAACEINIYKIEGGLPALKIPETKRMFGSHNERISVMQLTMACENPLEGSLPIRSMNHRDAWFNWYKAFERKIKWMRFQGRNMTVEGVYMYAKGAFPSEKHCPFSSSDDEFDKVHLAARMYAYNKINLILGFEYVRSPWYDASGMRTTSDRKMWEGAECDHLVDRYGRQVISGSGSQSGGNFLQPKMRGLFMDVLGEICDRYKGVGNVNGIFIVNGLWWMPGFLAGSFNDIEDIEVGYGDYTVGLFEKETKIKLNVNPDDPKRFEKRYRLLTGKYKYAWLNWRAAKVREFFGMVEKRLQKNDWKIYSLSQTLISRKNNPFADKNATRLGRDKAVERAYRRFGMPLELYAGDENIQIVPKLESIKFFTEDNVMKSHGWNTNPGTLEVIKKLGAVYLNDPGLNEIDNPARGAKKWLWSHTARGVFTARGIEDNCMDDLVAIMPTCVPKTIFYSWLDCNMTTAYGAQLRRFTKSFYVTPEAEFKNLSSNMVRGVVAQTAPKPGGGTWLKLVNDTPFALKGNISFDGKKIRDMVYDRDLKSSSGFFSSENKYAVEMKPNDLRIFELEGDASSLKCDFGLADKKIGEDIINQAVNLLKVKKFLRKVPGDKISEMYDALAKKDSFALYNLLDDYEVSDKTRDIKNELAAVDEQRKLLEDLKKTGRAGIICGSEKEYIDPHGNRWSPDQRYEKEAVAYGNENAYPVNRGNLPIGNTDLDKVYQTEVYGNHVSYHIPVPKGRYNVILHFAETYSKNKKPGARSIEFEIEQREHDGKIDPFAMAGGFAKALVIKEENIPVYDGIIDIELNGNVAINGIEIERLDK